jgi:hypothetical protein
MEENSEDTNETRKYNGSLSGYSITQGASFVTNTKKLPNHRSVRL